MIFITTLIKIHIFSIPQTCWIRLLDLSFFDGQHQNDQRYQQYLPGDSDDLLMNIPRQLEVMLIHHDDWRAPPCSSTHHRQTYFRNYWTIIVQKNVSGYVKAQHDCPKSVILFDFYYNIV